MTMQEQEIGLVTHFFPHPVVAGIHLTAPLKVGERIRIKGHSTDLTLLVESMQVNNAPVPEAKAGDDVGIKLPDRARHGDKVYRLVG